MINMVMLPLTEPEQNLSSIRITKTMVVLMEDIRNSTLKVEMAMISLVTSLEVCSVAEETTKDSIEAVSIKEVLALLMDLEVVDSEVDPSDRKVPTHTQISLLVLMKRLRAAIKSFICKIKMVRCSHYRFIYQPELIQEKDVRLRGKGNPGIGGGEAGDLFLEVTVGEKQGFERKGNDVYTTINVPFSTAVCGGEAVIKTLYGNVICKIKEGTQSGSKDQTAWKRNAAYEESISEGRSIRSCSDSGSKKCLPAGKKQIKRIRSTLWSKRKCLLLNMKLLDNR